MIIDVFSGPNVDSSFDFTKSNFEVLELIENTLIHNEKIPHIKNQP